MISRQQLQYLPSKLEFQAIIKKTSGSASKQFDYLITKLYSFNLSSLRQKRRPFKKIVKLVITTLVVQSAKSIYKNPLQKR